MPALSDADIIHSNSGTTVAVDDPVVSLAGADTTTEGNTVVIFFSTGIGLAGCPDGFNTDLLATGAVALSAYRRAGVGGGESSWVVPTVAAPAATLWVVLELGPNIATGAGIDKYATSMDTTGGTTSRTTGTTATTDAADTIALAAWSLYRSTAGGTFAMSGHTNGFVESHQLAVATAPTDWRLAVARRFSAAPIAYESTVSFTGDANQFSGGAVIAYPAAATVLEVPADVITGG